MCIITIGAMTLCLLKNGSAAEGTLSAIKLCGATVIPSLLPFMVLSSYIINSDMASAFGTFLDSPCKRIFHLPGDAACIILFSMIGGFPVGAKMISSAVERGNLTKNQGRRMMLFCVNAGPAFIINIVGASMLGSKKAGVILLFATIFSSLLVGFFTRFFEKEENEKNTVSTKKIKGGVLAESVEGTIKTMVYVCGWIVVFGAFSQIITDASLPAEIRLGADMLCEVTNGCKTAAVKFPASVVAFVLGFSGFAVHAQVLTFLNSVDLKYRLFFASRIINGAVSAAVAQLLFHFFPCEIQVFASSSQIIPVSFSVSAYASAAAIITASLIILDLAPTRKV
ncbi:MAG: hypothetical protein MJ120_01905 [Clostridia bacterium]|nr:hypothetical protein [Clostridia bacterium]